MQSITAHIGEGQAAVTVNYDIDDHGNVDIGAVVFGGVDIKDALSVDAFVDLETQVRKLHNDECSLVAAELKLELMEDSRC